MGACGWVLGVLCPPLVVCSLVYWVGRWYEGREVGWLWLARDLFLSCGIILSAVAPFQRPCFFGRVFEVGVIGK